MKRRILCLVSAFLLIGVMAVPCFATSVIDSAPWVRVTYQTLNANNFASNHEVTTTCESGHWLFKYEYQFTSTAVYDQTPVMFQEVYANYGNGLYKNSYDVSQRYPEDLDIPHSVTISCAIPSTQTVTLGITLPNLLQSGNAVLKIYKLNLDNWQSQTSGTYDQGYADGYDDGYEIGSADGESIGYNNGYTVGYDDGYDVGLGDGSSNSAVVGEAIEGYFGGVIAFLDIFMGLGIGALTVGNLIGLAVVTLVVILIIRIIRG